MTHDFRYYLKVRYGECDAQKVVFNPRYGDYIDLAASEFVRTMNLQDTDGTVFDWQVVKLTVEWKASARFLQVLELAVRTTHIGTTSFALQVDFRIAGDDAILARGEMVGVVVDETLKKRRISSRVREALQKGSPGVCVDHAGYLSQ